MAKIVFTAGLVAGFQCPPDKAQAFLWDATARGLGLRVTAAGSAAFVFQSTHAGRTVRVTIGSPKLWSLAQARSKAGELQRQIDAGVDPRGAKVAGAVENNSSHSSNSRRVATVSEAWAEYLLERRPAWSERHYRDHVEKAAPGGVPSGRGGRAGVITLPGPLAPLLSLPLRDLDATTVAAWAEREAAKRPTSARLAWRLLKAFLGWCGEQPAFAHVLPAVNPARTKVSGAVLGAPRAKSDALQREHLPAWFGAVRAIDNPVVGAYLQSVLLTGARPGEMLALRWDDLEPDSNRLTLRARLAAARTIPLTPYVARVLTTLPRRNDWVFSGQRAAVVARPNEIHTRACAAVGLAGLSLDGLRRSFKTLSEWANVPSAVVAQLMGQTASARGERSLELLHQHHVRIEAWILGEAGVDGLTVGGSAAA